MKTITRFTDFFYIITEMHITIIMKAHKKMCELFLFSFDDFPYGKYPRLKVFDGYFKMIFLSDFTLIDETHPGPFTEVVDHNCPEEGLMFLIYSFMCFSCYVVQTAHLLCKFAHK